MLVCLATGTAYSEQLPNKPFKVCPEVVTAKDTPCRVIGPSAAIVHRMEKPDTRDEEIRRLQEENALLRRLLEELKNKN